MRDYLAAADFAKHSVCRRRENGSCRSKYGGYSVFMLAGIHENRFKTFIAHDGLLI
jgi:hypothetical protein